MTLKYRRLIYLAFVLLFIIASIWLLLVNQGYVYNYTKNRFEQTGSLKIKTNPPGAQIILNGHQIINNSPTTIKKLLPDSYEVKLRLAGYQDWFTKIDVLPGQLTQVGELKLWPETQNGTELATYVNPQFSLSPNKNLLAYTINNGLNSGLWVLNLTSGKIVLLQRMSSMPIDFIEWSPNSHRLLLHQTKNGWSIYNLTDNTKQLLTALDNLNAIVAHWSEDDNDTIYFATSKEVYEINSQNNKAKLLWRTSIKDLRHHKNILYTLVQEGQGIFLRLLNLKNLQVVPLATEVPGSTDFIFFSVHNEWLPLLDTNKHTLYLLTSPLTSVKPIIIINDVIHLDWLEATNKLLLTNNYEVWLEDLDKDKKTLAYRISQPLNLARWFNEHYLLIAVDKDLLALEIDITSQQQKWLLTNQPAKIDNIFIDPTGNYLLLLTAKKIIRLPTKQDRNSLNS